MKIRPVLLLGSLDRLYDPIRPPLFLVTTTTEGRGGMPT
jgi:hypothetical protein